MKRVLTFAILALFQTLLANAYFESRSILGIAQEIEAKLTSPEFTAPNCRE